MGRHELLPVKSTAEGIAKYTGKYLSKGRSGNGVDKNVRRVEYIQGARRQSLRWSWHTPGAWLARQKLKTWAMLQGIDSLEEIGGVCGDTWSKHLKTIMQGTIACPDYFPTEWHRDLWIEDVRQYAIRDEWSMDDLFQTVGAAAELPISEGDESWWKLNATLVE